MKKLIGLSLAALMIFGMSSCKKYTEGGSVGKADKRIVGTWNLTGYERNTINEFSTLMITSLSETYTDGLVYSRAYTDNSSQDVSESGTYKFANDDLEVKVDGVSSIGDFSPAHSSVSSSTYILVKLTKDEYWYEYENGGDMHRFKFQKQ